MILAIIDVRVIMVVDTLIVLFVSHWSSVVNLEEYYDDQGDFGFRPSRFQ